MMQLRLTILAISALSAITSADARSGLLSSIVKEALESVRPHLKDLQIPSKTICVKDPRLDLTVSIDDGLVQKLENFRITKLSTSLLPLRVTNLTIVLDEVKVTGRYSANGRADFPGTFNPTVITGNGNAKIELKRIFLTVAGKFVLSGKEVQIAPKGLYGFDASLGYSKFELENLCGGGGSGKSMNEFLSNFLPELVNQVKKPIFDEFRDLLIKLINYYLSKRSFDFADTLEMIDH